MPHNRHDPEESASRDQSDRQIAEASRQVGISPRVLRYWEQSGVVKPSRDPAGRRHFNRHDLLAITLIQELLESSDTSIADLRLVRELAEREVAAAMSDPLTRLRLLFQRQAAEEEFHHLIEAMVPRERPPLSRPGHDPAGLRPTDGPGSPP